ncbi:sulfotransferase family protein [Lichenicoccus sp.]|uniref:sulfotransferase family protein n=1 Tax=Lichenicoccus sp. TaxID=2781899 RepID=UPI003D0A7AD0
MQLPKHSSRGRGRAHRVFHPLCGATLPTLARLLVRGGVAPQRLHVAALAVAMAGLRLPFTVGEAAVTALHHQDDGLPAPVFIVGHWRSGTTHLANLLSRSPAFGILSPMAVGLPAEALGLARIARPFVEQFFPRNRLIDAVALAADLPQEDELAMANLSTLSCNHGIYFPHRLREAFDRGVFLDAVGAPELRRWIASLRGYVGKMTRAAGRPLLIRNPANSARIPLLRAIWPEARFIHIHRHPAEVYASSVRMFSTLVRELSLGRPDANIEALVRHVYPRLMTRLLRDTAALPAGRFAEVGYDALRRQPLAVLERIHAVLELPGYDAARIGFSDYLDEVRDYAPRTRRPDPTSWPAGEHAEIFRSLGYALPDDAPALAA